MSALYKALRASKYTIILTIILVGRSPLFAQESSTAYNFLNIPASSHIYGLGGVNISMVENDVNVTDQNPALLGQEMDMGIGLNYMYYIGGSNFAGAKVAKAVGSHGAMCLSIQYFGYGNIQGADADGTLTGTFSPKDLSIGVAYSHDITDMLRGGINLKFLYSSYEIYSAMALATDIGINYFNPDRDLSLSLVVANLGGQIKRFDESYDRLPIDVRAGWTKSFGSLPIRFSITAWNMTKWKLPYYETGDGSSTGNIELKDSFSSNLFRHLIFAADFVPSERFHIGLGYNHKTRTDMSTYSRNILSGFSACAGINVKSFGVDVAFAQPHTGATTFMLNLTVNLNDFIR